jgi:hypothetical protein
MKFASRAQTKSKTGFGSSSPKLKNPLIRPSGSTGLYPVYPYSPSGKPVRAEGAEGAEVVAEEMPPPYVEAGIGIDDAPTGIGGIGGIGGVGGVAFSEFVEFVARVAVEGLQQENYDAVFPTPFAKVLAVLTVWGVADLKKLEEVRIIHTEVYY